MKRRSRGEWERLISEFESSGETRAAFCEARGVSITSLERWKQRLLSDTEPYVELPLKSTAEPRGTVKLELPGGAVFRLIW